MWTLIAILTATRLIVAGPEPWAIITLVFAGYLSMNYLRLLARGLTARRILEEAEHKGTPKEQ
jgi:phosphatidylglycerophosphate synthase